MSTQDPNPWVAMLAIGLFFVVFPLFWTAVSWLLARLSGWHGLAKRFPGDPSRSVPVAYTWGRVGFVNYNGVLGVGFDESGVHLRVFPLFPCHRPIRIPRTAIREVSRQSFFMKSWVEVRIDDQSPTLRIPVDIWHDE